MCSKEYGLCRHSCIVMSLVRGKGDLVGKRNIRVKCAMLGEEQRTVDKEHRTTLGTHKAEILVGATL